jgi:hypothetical protein
MRYQITTLVGIGLGLIVAYIIMSSSFSPSGGSNGNATSSEVYNAYAMAHELVRAQVQTAVSDYAIGHTLKYPVLGDAMIIDGINYHIIDFNALLVPNEGILRKVPDGTYLAAGVNNDNCDGGANGCSSNNHYIWIVDSYGSVYSICMGDDCNSNVTDGYQGIWP